VVNAAHLAGDPDPEFVGMIVAAITFVDMDAAGLDPGQRFELGDHRSQGMAVKRVAVQGLGVQHELPALGPGRRVVIETLQPNS
jgi:hypothetical protein